MLENEKKGCISFSIALGKTDFNCTQTAVIQACRLDLICGRSMVEVCMDELYHTRAVGIFLHIQVVTLVIISPESEEITEKANGLKYKVMHFQISNHSMLVFNIKQS